MDLFDDKHITKYKSGYENFKKFFIATFVLCWNGKCKEYN